MYRYVHKYRQTPKLKHYVTNLKMVKFHFKPHDGQHDYSYDLRRYL